MGGMNGHARFNWDAFRETLKQAMYLDGISANKVAAECGVSPATMSRLLSNGVPVSLDSVITLTRWMGRSIDEFTDRTFTHQISDVTQFIETPPGGDLYEYGDNELLMEFKNGDKFRIRISRTI